MDAIENYTEYKSKMISKLHRNVELATIELNAAKVNASINQKIFDTASSTLNQNKVNQDNAHNGYILYETLLTKLRHAETKSKNNINQSQTIVDNMTNMLKKAYQSAEDTIHAAQITIELTRLITKTKVTHKLLSDLLIADVKNADAAADTAVADTLTALTATITACQAALSLKEYTDETDKSLIVLVTLLKTGETGLKEKLDRYIKELGSRKTEMEKVYNKAKKESTSANEHLTDATDHLALSQTAYDAVLTAVNLGS